MKKVMGLLTCFLVSNKIFAASLDESINELFAAYTTWFVDIIFYQIPFAENIKIPWVLLVLFLGALFLRCVFNL
jgi:alanine or glycine:cation symporter, AGCS family